MTKAHKGTSFYFILIVVFTLFFDVGFAQSLQDDFEGNGNITTWYGDDCTANTSYTNPFSHTKNLSEKVMKYHDNGGLYANVRFDSEKIISLERNTKFTLKVYVASSDITGNQRNQVSLKLQNSNLNAPWSTQCEIIKPILLNQWQELSFDFASDTYINLDEKSLNPTKRQDFDRLVLQVNGENNTDKVTAYFDDFIFLDTAAPNRQSVYDQLIWSDEFDIDGPLDQNKWFQQTKLPNGNTWYNGEIQHYTDQDSNAYVRNGILSITARKENYTNQNITKDYTSARLNSKFAFTYGRVQVRAKMPRGIGTWPAIWMLGKNIEEPGAYWQEQGFATTPWPACGEIDIVEHWGNNQNYVSSATHTTSSSGNTVNVGGRTLSTASDSFHTYELEWSEEKLVFSIDEKVHFTYYPTEKNPKTWPFDAAQYLLLNVAIQPSIIPTFSKSSMDIDYVRIYGTTKASTSQKTALVPIIYPNPVQDKFTIKLNHIPNEPVHIRIYNTVGVCVKTLHISTASDYLHVPNLNQLDAGIYIVRYQLKDTTFSAKFWKR